MPKPWDGYGWMDNGEPLWCGPDDILQKKLIDVLQKNEEKLNDDNVNDDIDQICTEQDEDCVGNERSDEEDDGFDE